MCDHLTELFLSFPRGLQQLTAWFDGAEPSPGCTITNVSLPGTAAFPAVNQLSGSAAGQAVANAINQGLVAAVNAAL